MVCGLLRRWKMEGYADELTVYVYLWADTSVSWAGVTQGRVVLSIPAMMTGITRSCTSNLSLSSIIHWIPRRSSTVVQSITCPLDVIFRCNLLFLRMICSGDDPSSPCRLTSPKQRLPISGLCFSETRIPPGAYPIWIIWEQHVFGDV